MILCTHSEEKIWEWLLLIVEAKHSKLADKATEMYLVIQDSCLVNPNNYYYTNTVLSCFISNFKYFFYFNLSYHLFFVMSSTNNISRNHDSWRRAGESWRVGIFFTTGILWFTLLPIVGKIRTLISNSICWIIQPLELHKLLCVDLKKRLYINKRIIFKSILILKRWNVFVLFANRWNACLNQDS